MKIPKNTITFRTVMYMGFEYDQGGHVIINVMGTEKLYKVNSFKVESKREKSGYLSTTNYTTYVYELEECSSTAIPYSELKALREVEIAREKLRIAQITLDLLRG